MIMVQSYDPLGTNCTPPVQHMSDALVAETSAALRYSKRGFPVRGGAFVIHADDRVKFDRLGR